LSLSSSSSPVKMIKVAIAGTNGLAQLIANLIATQTYHQFIILSRNASFLSLRLLVTD
jgi:hypothetical protein